MKRALRVSLGIVVLPAAVGWPFIWAPFPPDNEFFARLAVELLMLWLAWWLLSDGPGAAQECKRSDTRGNHTIRRSEPRRNNLCRRG